MRRGVRMSHRRAKKIRAYIRGMITLDQERHNAGLPTQTGHLTSGAFRKLYRAMKRAWRDAKGQTL